MNESEFEREKRNPTPARKVPAASPVPMPHPAARPHSTAHIQDRRSRPETPAYEVFTEPPEARAHNGHAEFFACTTRSLFHSESPELFGAIDRNVYAVLSQNR